MVFKNTGALVLLTIVALTLEGLRLCAYVKAHDIFHALTPDGRVLFDAQCIPHHKTSDNRWK